MKTLAIDVLPQQNVLDHVTHIALNGCDIRRAWIAWLFDFVVGVVLEVLLVVVLLVTVVAVDEV